MVHIRCTYSRRSIAFFSLKHPTADVCRREVERAAAAESAKAAASAAASKERFRQIAAATELQAWARGMETRQVVSTALSDRGLPPVGESGRLRGVRSLWMDWRGGGCCCTENDGCRRGWFHYGRVLQGLRKVELDIPTITVVLSHAPT